MSSTIKRVLALLLALAIVFPPAAQAGSLKLGMKFTAARKLLLSQSWQPVNVHSGEAYEYIGIETALAKAQVLEVDSCAIDRPLCIFNYRKDTACLRLITRGERLTDMRVESWSDACPN